MSYVVTVTVPAGKVASTLTDFVTRVDLSHMPAGWWADTATDLGNVRVKSAGTVIPFDVVSYDRTAKTGELFFKATLTTGAASFTVETVTGATALAATDPNGRNAVWADYDAVAIAPSVINRVDGAALTLVGTVSTSGNQWSFPGGGSGYYHTGNVLPRRSTYTFGASYTPSAVSGDRHFTSYGPIGSPNTTVATIATSTNPAPNAFALWNSTNGFVGAEVVVATGVRKRAVCTYDNGLATRSLYLDGAVRVNGNPAAARPGGTGNVGLYVGTGVQGSSNSAIGTATYFYLRNGILSADWIAAEATSWETPASFYTVADTSGGGSVMGAVSATLPSLSASLSGAFGPSGTVAAVLPDLAANLAGSATAAPITGSVAAALPDLTGNLAGESYPPGVAGDLAAVLPSLAADLAGTSTAPSYTGTLAAVLPALRSNLAGQSFGVGTEGYVEALLPALSATLSGDVLGRTGLGLALDSTATLTVADVLEPEPTAPAGTPPTVLHIIAPTVPVPTLVAGRPQ